jgi:hypothetical protein
LQKLPELSVLWRFLHRSSTQFLPMSEDPWLAAGIWR